ncbi:DUF1801 domain-containing protein [Hahella aquimaris]|uniref:DUF1801 domain-containing protein n=1 Tax=Hahella sp. HNIBRBA332 TaxID=3015983 RepID=UPI00273AC576|nr:DUF1801 domain-containing protein [Hahella sp. HNIBRBA332]WLQ11722.1 DUF1801 domain-containing protein [Hahella sp. HNIBRBA332]
MNEARLDFADARVQAVFAAYPDEVRAKLLFLRDLIFDVARNTDGVGELEETLKWGQPSYLTAKTKSGSTLRIDGLKSQPSGYAVYFHCQTNLVETFRRIYGDEFRFEGNRSMLFDVADDIPVEALRHCIAMTLTYHLRKNPARKDDATRGSQEPKQ